MTQDIYTVLQKYDIPNTMTNVMAMEAMVNDRNGVFRQIFGESAKGSHKEENEEQLARAKEQVLEDFGEAIASPEGLAAAQEQLAEVAENVMKGMIDSDDVTSLDIGEMRLLSAQLSIGSMMAKEEQYAIPVQTESGVVGISLKVVRGDGEKGLVDITMETKLHGKIAATFQAKEHGVSGLIASDREDTKELFRQPAGELTAVLDSGNEADLHYACIADLDLNHFFNRRLWRGCIRTAGDHRETVGYDVSGADNKAIPYCGKLCAAGAGSFAGNRCAGSGCIKQLKQGFFFEIGEYPQIDGMSKLALIIFGQEQIGFALVA